MSEWEVVGVIIVLAGFVISVVTPLLKLTSTITRLTNIVETCEKELSELTATNQKSHARIYERIESESHRIDDHEKRIIILEEHDK